MEFIFPELSKFNTLCFIDDKTILVSKKNKIYTFSLHDKTISLVVKLPCKFITKVFLNFNLISRIFRSEIVYGIHFFENNFLVCFENHIYNINILDHKYKKIFTSLNGRRPLTMSVIKNSNSFEDGVYFGEYFANPNKKDVKIYRINFEFNIKEIYIFEQGKIEHIHSLVFDNFRDCIWVLTGDFKESAAIWQVKNNFNLVIKIFGGNQLYRSCVAFPLKEGLLYATDSQYQQNTINLLSLENENWKVDSLCNINGPVIYGTKYKNMYLFSTSVEGISSDKPLLLRYLDRKSGPGISEDYSHIVLGNIENGFETIFKSKKDRLPFVLFQFGVFTFPNGENLTPNIICSPRALKIKKKTLVFKL